MTDLNISLVSISNPAGYTLRSGTPIYVHYAINGSGSSSTSPAGTYYTNSYGNLENVEISASEDIYEIKLWLYTVSGWISLGESDWDSAVQSMTCYVTLNGWNLEVYGGSQTGGTVYVGYTTSATNTSLTNVNPAYTIYVRCVPNSGYTFKSWSVSSGTCGTSGTTSATGGYIYNAETSVYITATFESSSYDVSLYVYPPDGGTVSGAGTYASGTSVTISATPNTGYTFGKWSDEKTSATRTITVTSDVSLTARFTPNTYNVTVNQATGGTCTASSSTVTHGGSVSLTFTPTTGYKLSSWSFTGTGTKGTNQITNIQSDVSVTPVWTIQTFSITGGSVTGGTVYVGTSSSPTTTSCTVSYGGTVYVRCDASSGYTFSSWSKTCGGTAYNTTSATGGYISNVTSAGSVTASFDQIPSYTVSLAVSPSGAGSTSGAGTYNAGTTITISATPNTGYSFNQWSDGNTSASRSITVNSDISLTAVFTKQTFTVSLSTSPSGAGSLSGAGTYSYGATASISASPYTGYSFNQWSDGNTSRSRTLTVTSNTSLTAYFDDEWYTNGDYRQFDNTNKVTGLANYEIVTIPSGYSATFTLIAYTEANYDGIAVLTSPPSSGGSGTLSSWASNYGLQGSAVSGNGGTATVTVSAGTYYVCYRSDTSSQSNGDYVKYKYTTFSKYTITGGKVTGGTVYVGTSSNPTTTSCQVDPNGTVYVKCDASTGYALSSWSKTCGGTAYNTTSATGGYISGVSSAGSVTATFSTITYNISFATVTGGSASASPNPVSYNGTTTLSFTPNDGYRLSSWSFTGTATKSGNTLTNVLSNITVTPVFEVIPTYTITVNQTTGGTCTANPTTVREGNSTTLTFTPSAGYDFTSWTFTGTGTKSGNTITNVGSNITVTPTWTIKQYTVSTDVVGQGDVYVGTTTNPSSTSITVDYGTRVYVKCVSATNYTFQKWEYSGSSTTSGTTSATGGYITVTDSGTVTGTFTYDLANIWYTSGAYRIYENTNKLTSHISYDTLTVPVGKVANITMTSYTEDGYDGIVLCSSIPETSYGTAVTIIANRYGYDASAYASGDAVDKTINNVPAGTYYLTYTSDESSQENGDYVKYTYTLVDCYNVTIDPSIVGGTVTVGLTSAAGQTSVSAVSGTMVYVKCVPDNDHRFSSWSNSGAASASGKSLATGGYITINGTNEVISATFTEIIRYNVYGEDTSKGTITVSTDNTNWDASCRAEVGSTIYVKVVQKEGYEFISWSNSGTSTTYGTTSATNGYLVLASNENLTATYRTLPKYTVTVDNTAVGGTLGVGLTPSVGQTSITVYEGTKVYVKCILDNNYELVSWTSAAGNPSAGTTQTSGGYITVYADDTISATYKYEEKYNISVGSVSNGTVTIGTTTAGGDSSLRVSKETQVYVKCVPNSGYTLSSWTNDSSSVASGKHKTENGYIIATANETITATFTPITTYTITTGSNVTVGLTSAGGSSSLTVTPGTKVYVKCNATSSSNKFVSWSKNGSSNAYWTNNYEGGYIIAASNETVSATYASSNNSWYTSESYNLLYKRNYNNNKSSSRYVNHDEIIVPTGYTATISMKIENAYTASSDNTKNGIMLTAANTLVPTPSSDTDIMSLCNAYGYNAYSYISGDASNAYKTVGNIPAGSYYVVNVIATTGAEMTGHCSYSVMYTPIASAKVKVNGTWTNATRAFIKQDGHWVEKELVASDLANIRTIMQSNKNIQNSNVSDTFYTTALTAGSNGQVFGGGTYKNGTSVNIGAIPNLHYSFDKWSDNNTTILRRLTPSQNTSLSASFAIDKHNIYVNAGTGGTATGSGTYDYGSTANIVATPSDHYKFSQWNDGNVNANRNITVEKNIIYTAAFALQTYTVTLTAGTGGTVSGSGTYAYGTQVTISATPSSGYSFSKWNDGDTNATRSITVSGNITLTASFTVAYIESIVRYTSSGTVSVPDGMLYADIFLVNGGNGGDNAASKSSYGAGGSGGNTLTQNSINVSGSITINIGSAGAVGIKGGTTSVVIGGTTYAPSAQPANTKTGTAGTNGIANPFGKIGSDSDSNLYGAQGGCGNYGSFSDVHAGGTTGGGTGGTAIYVITYSSKTDATAGSFYGAGGGGGGRPASGSKQAYGAAGYQGCVIIRWKNKIQ